MALKVHVQIRSKIAIDNTMVKSK